jgi:hypothetical protein
MLLEEPNDKDKLMGLAKVSEGLMKKIEPMTDQVMVIGLLQIHCLFQCLLLTTSSPPKDPAVALKVQVCCIHQ